MYEMEEEIKKLKQHIVNQETENQRTFNENEQLTKKVQMLDAKSTHNEAKLQQQEIESSTQLEA